MNYRADPRQNISDLKNYYRETYKRAQWLADNGKSSEAMKTGTAVHELLELCGEVPDKYIISPHDAYRSGEAKAWKKKVEAEGRIPLKQSEFDAIQDMVSSVWNNCPADIKAVIQNPDAQRERAVFTEHNKSLEDLFMDGVIYDYKKTAASTPEKFMKDAEKFDYDMQAKFYLDNDEAAHTFIFIAVSSIEPHEVWCFECSDDFLSRGQMKIDIARENKSKAQKTPEVYTLSAPAWANQAEEQEDISDFDL